MRFNLRDAHQIIIRWVLECVSYYRLQIENQVNDLAEKQTVKVSMNEIFIRIQMFFEIHE